MRTPEQIMQSIKKEEKLIKQIELFKSLQQTPPPFPGSLSAFIEQPLGISSPDFIHYVQAYLDTIPEEELDKESRIEPDEIKLWLLLEHFALNVDSQEEILITIRKKLIQIASYWVDEHLNPMQINLLLIRNVYLHGNKQLITLFAQYLPIPPAHVFYGYTTPAFIREKTSKEAQDTVDLILQLNVDVKKLEELVITFQRKIRGKLRQREERKRIGNILSQHQQQVLDVRATVPSVKARTDEILKDANTPYAPKCESSLAIRIIHAAQRVRLFSTIKHLTVPQSLHSIFNCFYGGKNLIALSIPFRESAYSGGIDGQNGDDNVICFGAQEVDPTIFKYNKFGAQIVLKVDELDPTNPCVFYKQRDFGYFLDRTRSVAAGKLQLFFSHTNFTQGCDQLTTKFYLSFAQPSRVTDCECYSLIENHKLIAYDFMSMHQILTLNFFRFIDNLRLCKDNTLAQEQIDLIYKAISELSTHELLEFLANVGKQLTDTMEFNFYGAYRLNFDAIETLNILTGEYKEYTYTQTYTNHRSTFSLNMQEFIRQLQNGEHTKLNEAQANIPTIFSSYRFIDYLLSKISVGDNSRAIIGRLQALRASCIVPAWLSLYKAYIARSNPLEAESRRHESPEQQREYDKQFGLIISPKHLW